MAKDRSQPLPPPSTSVTSDGHYDSPTLHSNTSSLTLTENSSSKLARAFSKRTYGGTTPKTNSPTHIPLHSTKHSPGATSPTSPNHTAQQQTLNPRFYTQPGATGSRLTHDPPEDPPRTQSRGDRLTPGPTGPTRTETPSTLPGPITCRRRTPGPSSVEIFKSFRVSWEDPCYKVLPAALRKYNIHSDPKDYALYIVYGDQERCLQLDEKPLLLFKQLEREGRKPMFMLRKIQSDNPYSAGIPASAPNSAGFDTGRQASINLPGGVL
ncbi:hypothetical protein N7468_003791 [Penicillium chermesinum]|uniref:Ras-associating domain-containing protein n=1 Tax=Penicillium chermesinum TaxID=63820 RepID=A0A9W9P9Z9_9EURO|nr:uncharacterized protein N7468_003791 [Penicillium chermesinum]KAJ5239172.1 hypothetical protein N7468_003791 [Penicillium chermesinum]